MADNIASQFLEKGLLGAIIVTLAIVIVYLYRVIQSKDAKIEQISSDRLADAKEWWSDMVEYNQKLQDFMNNMQKVVDLTLSSRRAIND